MVEEFRTVALMADYREPSPEPNIIKRDATLTMKLSNKEIDPE